MPDAPKTLLIIDDEKDLSDVLSARFAHHGYEVHSAANGLSGLELAAGKRPSCILLDARMPVMDGLTMLRRLRSYRDEDPLREASIRRIPVVVLTCMDAPKMRPVFEMEKIQGYVQKPFDFKDLMAAVEQATAAAPAASR